MSSWEALEVNQTTKSPLRRSNSNHIKSIVEDELSRRMALQREVQTAVNLANASDTLHIFGSLWATFTSGVVFAKSAGRWVPPRAGIPNVVGSIVLGNKAGKL